MQNWTTMNSRDLEAFKARVRDTVRGDHVRVQREGNSVAHAAKNRRGVAGADDVHAAAQTEVFPIGAGIDIHRVADGRGIDGGLNRFSRRDDEGILAVQDQVDSVAAKRVDWRRGALRLHHCGAASRETVVNAVEERGARSADLRDDKAHPAGFTDSGRRKVKRHRQVDRAAQAERGCIRAQHDSVVSIAADRESHGVAASRGRGEYETG